MIDKEILEKAIRKAIDGGWEEYGKRWQEHLDWLHEPEQKEWLKYHDPLETKYTKAYEAYFGWEGDGLCSLIYNQDFAKALWGISKEIPINGMYIGGYKHYLQQMVIADDPIKYLGNNI